MVREIPEVEYGQDDWQRALPFALLALCVYSLGFMSIVAYAVVVAPRKAAEWPEFMERYRFAFGALRPDCWWWILIQLMYGLSLIVAQA